MHFRSVNWSRVHSSSCAGLILCPCDLCLTDSSFVWEHAIIARRTDPLGARDRTWVTRFSVHTTVARWTDPAFTWWTVRVWQLGEQIPCIHGITWWADPVGGVHSADPVYSSSLGEFILQLIVIFNWWTGPVCMCDDLVNWSCIHIGAFTEADPVFACYGLVGCFAVDIQVVHSVDIQSL